MTKIGNEINYLPDDSKQEQPAASTDTTNKNVSVFKVSRNMIGTNEDISHLMSIFDADNDGSIDYNEFQVLEKKYKEEAGNRNQKSSGISIAEFYNRIVNILKNGIGNDIYINGKIVNPDGNIDEVHQGKALGDCWFLSKINALYHTKFGKADLEAARVVKEGEYGVKISGKEYMFTVAEIQAAIDSKKYSFGDPDAIIYELAFEKYFDELLENPDNLCDDVEKSTISAIINNTNASSLNGGKNSKYILLKPELTDVIKLLTGFNTYGISKSDYPQILKMKAANNEEVAITFSSNYAITLKNGEPHIEKMDKNSNFGQECHEYELKNVVISENGDMTVIITNPWNNNEDIPLTMERFRAVSSFISVTTSNTALENEIRDIKSKHSIDGGKAKV